MNRRQFICVSAAGLACTALLVADQNDELKPREPDLVIDRHGGTLAFSPDSKVLAVANGPIGDSEGICFLDPDTGKRLPDFESTTDIKTRIGHGRPRVLAFSPDGKYFAAGGENYVALWDATNGRRLKNLEPLADREWGTVITLAFAPDSRYLFAGDGFWSLEPRGELEKLKDLGHYEAVTFSANEKYFATRLKGIITLWDHAQRRKIKEFGREQPTAGPLIFTPDAEHVLSWALRVRDRSYSFWNIRDGEPKYIPFQHRVAETFDLSADGGLVTGGVPGGISLMRVDDGKATATLSIRANRAADNGARIRDSDNPTTAIKFAPNQRTVAHSRVSGIRLWKEKNGFKA